MSRVQTDFWPELQRQDMVDLAKLSHVPKRAFPVTPLAADGESALLGNTIRNRLSDDGKTARRFEAQAKQNLRQKYGIDPDLPGWVGLVKYEAERLAVEAGGA